MWTFEAHPLARRAHLLQAQHAPQISGEDCAASAAFGGNRSEYAFHTARSEISLDNRAICAIAAAT
jgi:hypothetical protein